MITFDPNLSEVVFNGIGKGKKKDNFSDLTLPTVQGLENSDSVCLKNKEFKKLTAHPKIRVALRVTGFFTLPLSLTGLTLLALVAIPFQLTSQQQEIEKQMCLECRLQALSPHTPSEVSPPFLETSQQIMALIPRLIKFIFKRN